MVTKQYGKPPRLFSTLKRAEAFLLEDLRCRLFSGPFYKIIYSTVENTDYIHETKYTGQSYVAGNKRILVVKLPSGRIFKESYTIYTINSEYDLLFEQLSDFHYQTLIYFNDAKITRKLLREKKLQGKFERVKEKEILEYFKYFCIVTHKPEGSK